jgi:hypothetical protein
MNLRKAYQGFLITTGLLILAACSMEKSTDQGLLSPDKATEVLNQLNTPLPTRTQEPVPNPTTSSPTSKIKRATSTPTKTPLFTPIELLTSRTPIISTWYPLFPTSDTSELTDIWSNYYSDPPYSFSFEYPALYDSQAYSACKIELLNPDNYLYYLKFGYRSELAVIKNDLPSLDAFVERWISGMEIDYKDYRTINGLQGIIIDYRFGGLNRFGSSTFIGQDRLIYIFNFAAGLFCDLPEIQLDEYTIYRHALETFRLEGINP